MRAYAPRVQVAQFNNQKGSNAAKTPSHGCNLIKVRSRVIQRANATIHIRRGSARCSINGIPVVLRGLTHSPILHPSSLLSFFFYFLSTILSGWFKNIHFYSLVLIPSPALQITILPYLLSSKIWKSRSNLFNSSTKPWYIYFFNLYRTRKPINYTCIES